MIAVGWMAMLLSVHYGTGKFSLYDQSSFHQRFAFHPVVVPPMFQHGDFEPELVPGDHRMAKSAVFYPGKVNELGFPVSHRVKEKDYADLRQSLDQQHTRHYRMLREMPLEEGLVESNILESYHAD